VIARVVRAVILAIAVIAVSLVPTPARADEPAARPREPIRIPEMVVDGRAVRPHVVVVTERATNSLDTYKVSAAGWAGSPVTTASSGPTPYGFAFDLRNHPIVSEATNSTLSSYRLSSAGATVISASVPTGGIAACWVTVTPNGRWAFDTNAHGGTVSSFEVHANGAIELAHSVAANTGTGSAPLDLQVTSDGRFLYVNEAGANLIGGYRIGAGGTLAALSGAPVLPAGASGLAVS